MTEHRRVIRGRSFPGGFKNPILKMADSLTFGVYIYLPCRKQGICFLRLFVSFFFDVC